MKKLLLLTLSVVVSVVLYEHVLNTKMPQCNYEILIQTEKGLGYAFLSLFLLLIFYVPSSTAFVSKDLCGWGY